MNKNDQKTFDKNHQRLLPRHSPSHTLGARLKLIDSACSFIGATRVVRYRVFILTAYFMGLGLDEALNLHVGDIDAQRMQVHIRRGKVHKDRLLPFPDLTLQALRALWLKHCHSVFFSLIQWAKSKTFSTQKTYGSRWCATGHSCGGDRL